jgi:glutamate carboxypeptidase
VDLDLMLADLGRLVSTESPSRDIERLTAHAQLLADLMEERLGSRPVLVESSAGPHVHWRGGAEPHVLILGHHDTVHPAGTVVDRPFAVRNGRATGPGVFDMKAGIVQAIHAVASLADSSRVEILLTADEEVGSRDSRALLEARARAAGAVLVLEPAAEGGDLKTGRKGTGTFTVTVEGRAAHAGLEPEKGVNALVELAGLIVRICAIARPEVGTTVSPTLASAGTADNVIPARAECTVDVRVAEPAEKARVEAQMAALTAATPGAVVRVTGGIGRPPMPETAATDLFAIAVGVAGSLGLGTPRSAVVGGGSDGNFTAAAGVATLDGLGAVGGGAHAEDEHVLIDEMPRRARLLAGICQEMSSMARRPPLGSVPVER